MRHSIKIFRLRREYSKFKLSNFVQVYCITLYILSLKNTTVRQYDNIQIKNKQDIEFNIPPQSS